MITSVDFSEKPIAPGESRTLRAWSDIGPLFVAIECFREPPSPPSLAPCQECGNYSVGSGQAVLVKASNIFDSGGGYLRIVVRDMSGDEREFRLTISRLDETRAYAR